jgi:hypothetical protein
MHLKILTCKILVIAAEVGALRDLFMLFPACLYKPDNTIDLIQKLIAQINKKVIPNLPIPSWEDQAKKLDFFLTKNFKKKQLSSKC